MGMLYGHYGVNGLAMRLRYSISQRSQTVYIHGRDPVFLYLEYEGNYPHIWIECDNTAHQYPRRIHVHDTQQGPYMGPGTLVPYTEGTLEYYDCGPGTTDEFNQARLPNVAPYNPINTGTQGETE